jgi:hypothetical protein
LAAGPNGSEGVMTTVLTAALRESRGYMTDQGWHQTARLMAVAAEEIERLSQRIRELEDGVTAQRRAVSDG